MLVRRVQKKAVLESARILPSFCSRAKGHLNLLSMVRSKETTQRIGARKERSWMALCWHGRCRSRGVHGKGRWGRGVACEKRARGSWPSAMPVSARPVLTSHARGAQLFAVVPLSSLGVGPEVTNNMCKCLTPPSRPPMRRAVQFVPYGSCPRAVRVPDFTPAPPRVPVHPALLRFPAQLRRWIRDILPAWPG